MSEWDPNISSEERVQTQADVSIDPIESQLCTFLTASKLRAKQQAALDKRIAFKKKKVSTTAGTIGQTAKEPKTSEQAIEKTDGAPTTPELVSDAESEPESRSSSEREFTPEERAQAQIDVR